MGARGYYTYVQTSANHREAINDDLLQLENTFLSLQRHANDDLFRVAYSQVIPDILNLETSRLDGQTTAQEAHALSLSGIDSINYLTTDGQLISTSRQATSTFKLSNIQIQRALKTIAKSKQAFATVDCNSQCYHQAFVPSTDHNGRSFIININRSVEILIDDFWDITGSEMAIVGIENSHGSLQNQLTMLASRSSSASELLQKFSKNIDRGDLVRRNYIGHKEKYSARFFPLLPSASGQFYIATIKDNSQVHGHELKTVKEIFLSSLITLALIMLLIAVILRPSLNRLLGLAKILPLLPQGRFDDARQSLNKLESNSRWGDEIDILATTFEKVISSLDSMDQIVTDHRNELASKIDALTEAKVFNETLLDSSPLAIIIHDAEGKIRNINKLGRQLCGLSEQTPPDANINSWVKNDRQSTSLTKSLHPILNSEGKKIQGETSFFTSDGRKLDFLWTHSSLFISGELSILSLGIDITERREATESLRWLGQHDRVTGLLNRNSFTEDANNYISRYQKVMLIELLMIDIDDFAIFNDRHGFEAGDKLLNDLAAHLHQSLPQDTLLSRTGSGEFCALIHHELDTQLSARDLCLDHLMSYTFKYGDDEEQISLSGVIDSFNENLSGIDELISNTTSTMLRVKNKFRGHLFYADGEDDDSSRSSRHKKYQMKEQLLSALNDNRLVLFYQPILDLKTNTISHCECLVRLLDNEGQFIAPAKFLGIASESGLLPKLDYSVIEKAMRQQYLWEESGITTGLSINITAPTLEQADFKQRIEELIHLTGANPHRLIFEIVETDAISNLHVTHDLLNHFKDIGAKIAFDDFGIGFTSFEYVRDLPVDYIKIDQSFIRFIHEREQDQVLVKSMVEMSHSLGKKVIVEGVENKAALKIVKDMGVEYVQGYYVCRPMPISALDLSLHLRH